MIARRVGGAPVWAVALGVGAAALVAVVAVQSGRAETAFVAVAGLLVAAASAYLIWYADPVWPLSLGIGLTVFSGNWGYLGVPALDRLCLAAGVVAVLVRAPGARDRPGIEMQPVHWAMIVAAAWATASAVWAGTLTQSIPFFRLVDRFGLLPFLLFTVAPVAFRTARQRAVLVSTLVVTGAYLGLTAFLEVVGPRALIFPRYIADASIGLHQGRARGPFLEAGAMGLALFFCAVACAIAVATWTSPRLRVLAAAVALLDVLGVLFTLTRANWIATVVAVVVTGLAFRELRRHLLAALVVGAVLVAAAFAFVPGLSTSAEDRTNAELPVWDRLNTDRAALRMIGDSPLFGIGWSRFEEDSPPYFEQASTYPVTGVGLAVHNVFLAYLAEIGVVGFLTWLVAFLLAVGGAISTRGPPELRPWRIGLLAITLNWFVVANLSPLSYALPNLLMWTWAGVAWPRGRGEPRPAG